MAPNDFENYNVKDIPYTFHSSPKSQISLHFKLRLAISKIVAFFIFQLATMLHFNLFQVF